MKKLRKRYISVIMTAFIFMSCIPITTAAGFTDVPENASFKEALDRMISLGVITDSQNFNPDALLTREQFAKMIVIAAGLENTANSMKGSTIFPDITINSWSSGYINVAVNKGFITGWYDGKFRPAEPITMTQICTSFLKALGYTSQNISGEWPDSYIIKAGELGLTDGITLDKNAGVPRWAAVVMLDRLMDTNMNGSSEQTFIESTGYYTKCTVFGDSTILDTLSAGQVLTDKGIYSNPSNIKLELGSENYIAIKNGNIQKAAALSSVKKISVIQANGNRVTYMDGDAEKDILLPGNITYYYNGQETKYADIEDILQKSAAIVMNYTSDKSAYSFAVVFDPVYSEPGIADSFTASTGTAGSIRIGNNSTIMRNDERILRSQIEAKDVVYQVSDIWGGNTYITAIDNKVGGKIMAVSPNSLSPKTLQIDGISYNFSQDVALSKINAANTSLIADNYIVVYLGYDGTIVNIEGFGTEDNSGFAFVLDNGYSISTDTNGTKKYIYTARLLFSDGFNTAWNTKTNYSELKGKLVKYTLYDSETLALEPVSYNSPNGKNIDRLGRQIGDSYVTDNAKIFNIVYNDTSSTLSAEILEWNDLPNGPVSSGKILYANTVGAFSDINVLLFDDIRNERYKTGIVKDISNTSSGKTSTSAYTVLIDGSEYTYSKTNSQLTIGSVFKFEMSAEGIDSVIQTMYPAVTGTTVQAYDARRIKMNNTVYFFGDHVSVYYKDSDGNISTESLSTIDTSRTYQKVSLYTENGSDTDSNVNIVYLIE